MSGERVIVITRQLDPHNAVVSTVIGVHDRIDNDTDIDRYLISMGMEYIKDFKNRYVEFVDADWNWHLMDVQY